MRHSVIIPAFICDIELVQIFTKMLESLKEHTPEEYELVIVDNGSQYMQEEMVGVADVYIRNKENLGFAGGNNKGIGYAIKNGADYVLLLNNDTTVDPFFLDRLVESGESSKNIGIIGPEIYFYSDPDRVWFSGGKINWLKTKGSHLGLNEKRIGKQSNGKTGKITATDYMTGCAMLIKKEVIEKIGGLSEDYFLYYEDTDYCLRAQKEGWQCVLAPESRIWHKISQSTKEFSPSYLYYHTRNGLMMAKRMNSPIKIILVYVFSVWLTIKQIVKYLFFPSKREWAKMVMLGICDFWEGETGKFP